jgi:hypothetical protein
MSALGTSVRQLLTESNSNSFPEYIAANGNSAYPYAAENSINNLSNVTITDANLTASEIPTNIVAANYLPLSGGTLSGTLNVSLLTASSTDYGVLTATNASTTLFSNFATAYFGGTATSSFSSAGQLSLAGISNALLSTNSSGQVVATSSIGTNLLTGALGTINGTALNAGGTITVNAASSTLLTDNNTFSGSDNFLSLLNLNGGLTAYASSTIGNGGVNGLTINGNATTTGAAYFASNVGIGTTSPWGILAVSTATQQNGLIPLFNIASTTNTSLFTVLGNGNVGIGTSNPSATLQVTARAGRISGTVTSSGTAVTGSGTSFLTQVAAGDKLQVGTLTATVASITDNTHLTLSAGFSHDVIVAANVSINPTNNFALFTMQGGTNELTVTANQGLTLQGDNTTAVLDTTNLLANADFATNDFTSWTAGTYWSAATGAAVHTASTTAAILNAASVLITNGGTGYSVSDVLTLPGGNGDAQITVATVSAAGTVLTFTLTNAGTGYTDNVTGTATGGTGTGFTFAIKQVTAGDTLVQTASPAMISGQSYQLTFVKSGSAQGAVTVSLGGVTLATAAKFSNAVQTFTFQATGNTTLTITPTADFNGTLDTFVLTHFENTVSPLITFNNQVGNAALEIRTSGTTNTFVGLSAGKRITTGTNNAAFGSNAFVANTTGATNSAFGSNALSANTIGTTNSAFGSNALSANTSGSGNSAFGNSALTANTASSNSAFGNNALLANTTGTTNSAFGSNVLIANTSGTSNIAVGSNALTHNTTGGMNVAVGATALTANTTASNNSAVGYIALSANTTGASNAAFGYGALSSNTTASNNSAFGFQALNLNTTGPDNTALGFQALTASVTGASNVAVGRDASLRNASATSTVAVGYRAGYGNNTAYNAQGYTLLGYQTGNKIQTGADWNTLIGYSAGNLITTGADNIVLGAASTTANDNLTTGSQNIKIGDNISFPSATASGQLDIQNILYGTGNTAIGANVSKGNIGIGTTSALAKLDVAGANNGTAPLFQLSSVSSFATTTELIVNNNGNATLAGCLNYNGGTSGTCLSDDRVKQDINSFKDGLQEVIGLNPVTYQYNGLAGTPDDGDVRTGLIAQQVQQVAPDLVSTTSAFLNASDTAPTQLLEVSYSALTFALINAVKEIASISASFQSALIAWLGNASNGIGDLFANNLHAQNEVCISSTCMNQQQLAALLAGASPSQSSGQGSSSTSRSAASTTPDTPPIIQINGDNPAIIQVGNAYNDLGATITGPTADLNLGITTYVNGIETNPIQIDTSAAATDTIDYVVTDQNSLTSTSSRTVIIESPSIVPTDDASSTAISTP